MLLDFYALQQQPFGVTPDPKFLFWSHSHREALASLYYGIESDCGFMALIAPPGMGKTTLLFQLLEKVRPAMRTAFLFQTQCDSRELLGYLLEDLGSTADGGIVALHSRLNKILLEQAKWGRRFVLIIDEAQNLDASVLETIRLLTDFETPGRKLIQIIVSGQPQLEDKLACPDLAQLRQRLSIVSRLDPLSPTDVERYVTHRLEAAGWVGQPIFTPGALKMIAVYSQGIPREINNICFGALSLGCAHEGEIIDVSIIDEVAADLELRAAVTSQARWAARPRFRRKPHSVVAISLAASAVLVLLALIFLLPSAHKAKRAAAPPQTRDVLLAPVVQIAKQAEVPQVPASAQPDLYKTVTVEPHDSLYDIVIRELKHPLDPELIQEIMDLNTEIVDPNVLQVGSKIRLPLGTLREPASIGRPTRLDVAGAPGSARKKEAMDEP
jgi:general secretion pathway protein A